MKFFLNLYEWVQKNIRPPSAFSWETLILLSVFSYYMAMLAQTRLLEDLLTNFGWIFLILGVHWWTTSANQLRIGYKPAEGKDGFPLSPWITGALVSLYLFGGGTGDIRREALIYWPSISAVIAAMPDFLGETSDGGLILKKAPVNKRQNLVVLFGTQFLLSCWLQFNFVIQDWLVQYPSLVFDDVRQSAFVVKSQAASSARPRGAVILEAMEPRLREQLEAKPWSEVERLLLKEERISLVNTLQKQATKQVSPIDEDELWQVSSDVSSAKSGYNLDLLANWQGPRAQAKENSLVKSCQITRVSPRRSAATKPINTKQRSPGTPISRVKCEPVKGWGIDPSTISNDTFIQ
ncbi:MAG TPA: DUF5357 family protein [Candidatus Sericytochromatia bacterium]